MAKQLGLHKVQGKVGEYSYYESKNGGSVIRGINKGMSSRVKTAQEYANTRKNNSEFGMCGDFAGAIIKPISLRWRFILDSIATGKMVKTIKEFVKLDVSGKWGERVLKEAYFDQVREAFTSFSKNEIPAEVITQVNSDFHYDSAANQVFTTNGVFLNADTVNSLIEAGANKIKSVLYTYEVTKPKYDNAAGVYTKAVSKLTQLSDFESEIALVADEQKMIIADDMTSSANLDLASTDTITGLVIILLPCRMIGGVTNILQQLCSACWLPITAGTQE